MSADSRVRRTGDDTSASTRSVSGASQSAVARTWSRPSSLRPGLALASPPEKRFSAVSGVTPCRTSTSVVRTSVSGDQPRKPTPDGSLLGSQLLERLLGGLGLLVARDGPLLLLGLGAVVGHAVAQPVERLVGQPVGVLVLLARHPGVRRPERREPVGLQRQRLHVGVLDLPAARHLLDDQLGVHPDLDLGVRGELGRQLQAADQAAVLRDVVGRHPDRRAVLGDHLAGVGVLEHRAVRRRARVAARAAVGLDHDPLVSEGVGHSPDSGVRTRIR